MHQSILQDLTSHKAAIIPFQPRESRFALFRRAPTLKFPNGEQQRDEVFLFAQVGKSELRRIGAVPYGDRELFMTLVFVRADGCTNCAETTPRKSSRRPFFAVGDHLLTSEFASGRLKKAQSHLESF